MTRAVSWQNSVSLCPASFCTPRPNLPVTPGIVHLSRVALKTKTNKRHVERGLDYNMVISVYGEKKA